MCGQRVSHPEDKAVRSVRFLALAVLPLVLLGGCRRAGTGPATPPSTGGTASGTPLALGKVSSWAFQNDGIASDGTAEALASAPYDMLVIEPTRTMVAPEDHSQFKTKDLVAKVKATPATVAGHRKLVLAVLDVASAEVGRWYWTWSPTWPADADRPEGWPEYILPETEELPTGVHPVAFWNPEWQKVLYAGVPAEPSRDYASALDEMLADGFDGVYLVGVDAVNWSGTTEAAEAAKVDAKAEMLKLIAALREQARQRNPGFLIVQQGALNLRNADGKLSPAVDGVAYEGLWYDGGDGEFDDPDAYDRPQDGEISAGALLLLRETKQKAKLPVFLLEYARAEAEKVYANARQEGFVAYCTHPSLARLSTTPPKAAK